MKDPLVVFDVGAGGGFRELAALQHMIHLYSFEPNRDQYSEKWNGKMYKSDFFSIALSDNIYTGTFYVTKHRDMCSLLPPLPNQLQLEYGEAGKRWGDTLQVESIETVKVDTIDNLSLTKHIDFLKIDTQGSEYNILKGASALLNSNRIGVVKLELMLAPMYENQYLYEELIAFMQEKRFTLIAAKLPNGSLFSFDNIVKIKEVHPVVDLYYYNQAYSQPQASLRVGILLMALGFFSKGLDQIQRANKGYRLYGYGMLLYIVFRKALSRIFNNA